MLSILPLAFPSKDTAPFGLGLLPGKRRLHLIRNQALNWLINQVVFRNVNQYANQVRQRLGLAPLTAEMYVHMQTLSVRKQTL